MIERSITNDIDPWFDPIFIRDKRAEAYREYRFRKQKRNEWILYLREPEIPLRVAVSYFLQAMIQSQQIGENTLLVQFAANEIVAIE